MHFLRSWDGTRLAYTTSTPPGVASPRRVVLCDGISCDGYIFRAIRPWLEARFAVLHVHYRGHGRSGLPREPGRTTLPDLCRDLEGVMAHVGWDDAVLIGHSMGVQVVLEMAFRYPRRVQAGILACGSHGRLLDSFGRTDLGTRILPALDMLMRRFRNELSTAARAIMPSPLAYLLASIEIKADRIKPEDIQPYLDHFSRMPLDLFISLLGDAAERTALPWLDRLTQPFLVVGGEDDGFTPLDTSMLLMSRLRYATWVMLPDTSHTAPLENPDAFQEAVAAFMEASNATAGQRIDHRWPASSWAPGATATTSTT
jgi:pimeloyl-ACP methyl ester carboxylesterase